MKGWAHIVAAVAFSLALTGHSLAQQPDPILQSAQSTPADAAGFIAPAPHQGGAQPVSAQETHPEIKRAASEIALALTTWQQGEGPEQIAGRLPRFADPAIGAALASTLYVPDSWSEGRIIYPQFGGLLPDSASVMVVTEQLIGTLDGVFVYVRTLDIRMRNIGGQWQFSELASIGGDVTLPPDNLPPEALAVLNDPRIELPDSARWDIFDGRVSPNLLTVMAQMAEIAPYGVVTLMSGHPLNVYGTDRQSAHARGLAVDVYRIGDDLVIDQRAKGSSVHQFVQWLYQQPGVSNIGSPWALDGFGGRSFTDALHQDHLHIAVHP